MNIRALTCDTGGTIPDWHSGLRTKYHVVALTILTTALVIDVSRKNRIDWDGVISCEMIGIYKRRPEAHKTAAKWRQLGPSEIMMGAAHNSDLLAACACRFRSAFIRRLTEWGPEGQPVLPIPDPVHDIIANDFADLATILGMLVRTSQDSAEGIRMSEIGGYKRSDDGPSEAKKDVRAASPL